MNIQLITFKTNHTLLAEVVEETGYILLKKPVQCIMQPTKDGPMMAFSPFIQFCEEFETGIRINNEDILCTTTPLRELVNQYSEMFGSGIQIATSIPKF